MFWVKVLFNIKKNKAALVKVQDFQPARQQNISWTYAATTVLFLINHELLSEQCMLATQESFKLLF